jgi:signal transduction histidine kinase
VSEPIEFAASRVGDNTVHSDPWKILIVDDEPAVHSVTRFALTEFEFEGKGLEFISAYSAEEAKSALSKNADAALVLLDVVMETEHSGLDLVRHVREEAANDQIRIVLRTGQPGQAPEMEVIRDYDINDYKEKTELTGQRLATTIYSSLRSFRDIVRLKRQGEALRRVMRAAEVAERAKAAFMATASHELRTPLNAILGLSQIMNDEMFGPLGHEKYKEYVWDIKSSGEELLAMIDDILDTADGTTRMAPLREEQLNLVEIIDSCLSGLKLSGPEGLVTTVKKKEPLMLRADRFAVRRMLLCLLSNAIKFASTPKHVEVVVRRLRDGQLLLAVRDDGPGIAVDDIERLTQGLPDKESAEVQDGSGLGLGLSIARQLIERHGGKLTLENSPEGGTLAGLVFPAERFQQDT